MKRNIFLFLLVSFISVLSMGCSTSSTDANKASAETGQLEETSDELDIEGLTALTKKSSDEITSADYDFLLEQAEIFANKIKGMSKEEMDAYKKTMSSDEMGAIIVIGMGLDVAKKKGALSEKQLERYERLEAGSGN